MCRLPRKEGEEGASALPDWTRHCDASAKAPQLALSALSFASRIGSRCGGRVLILKSHDRPGTYHRSQIDHVPVRQTDAAVGLRFADIVGFRRAMYPVRRSRKIDPNQADCSDPGATVSC